MKDQFVPPKDRRGYPQKCPICGGPIEPGITTLSFPNGDSVKIVHDVPAGICRSCGEEYLAADVAGALQRLLDSPPDREATAPVWKYAS